MKKIIDGTEKLVSRVLIALLCTFVSIVIVQVVARYIFKSPLTWTEQTARYMFIWMIMLGIPVTFRKNMNAAFDLVTSRMDKKIVDFINIFNTLLITFFAGYYFFSSMHLVFRSTKTIAQGINIPINYVYIAQPICAGLLILYCLEKLVNDIKIVSAKRVARKGGV